MPTRGLYPKIMLITGQSWGPAMSWLYNWWAAVGCHQGENVVGEPWGRRALTLYINCTVTERCWWVQSQREADGTAGCCRGGPGYHDGSLGNAAGKAVDHLVRKGFPECAGTGCQLQVLSGCALSWFYKPSFLDHSRATVESSLRKGYDSFAAGVGRGHRGGSSASKDVCPASRSASQGKDGDWTPHHTLSGHSPAPLGGASGRLVHVPEKSILSQQLVEPLNLLFLL